MSWTKIIPAITLLVIGVVLYIMSVNWGFEEAHVQVLKYAQKKGNTYCVTSIGGKTFLMTIKNDEVIQLRSVTPVLDVTHSIVSNVKVIVCKTGTDECSVHHLPLVILQPGTWDIYVDGIGTYCFKILKVT